MAKKKAKAKPRVKAKVKARRPAPKKSPLEGVRPTFKIENIVASANLGVELDLYEIAQEVKDVEYEPEQFPGAILKLKDPRASLLLFKNGKIICTGCKSEGEVEFSINRAVKLLASHARELKKE
jgi:transcription initiation factor TFIID TATA-box-binding protein